MSFLIWRGYQRHQVHVYTRYGIMKWPLLFGGGMSVPSAFVHSIWIYEMAFMIWRGISVPSARVHPKWNYEMAFMIWRGISVPSVCVHSIWNYGKAFMIWRGYQRPKCMCTLDMDL